MIRRAAPALVLGAVLLGAYAGSTRRFDPRAPALAAVLLALLAVPATGPARRRRAGIAAVLAVGTVGMVLAARAVDGLEHPPFERSIGRGTTGTLRGAVAGDPIVTPWRVAVTVRASEWSAGRAPPVSGGARSVLVVADPEDRSRLRALEVGDRVAFRGRLGPLDGYDARLRWRHVVARLDDASLEAVAPSRSPVVRTAGALRDLVLRGGAGLPASERGVLAAFLLGDERAIPAETLETFRTAGMSHLLVVSGANVAAVLALIGPVTRRLPLAARLVVGAATLTLFGAATRWEPSVLRAIAMAMVVLIGATIGRPVRGLRVLCLAATVLLLADPFLLHSVGFGLSCAATAGIAALAAPIARRLPGPGPVREGIAVTAAAQLGVAPLLVPVFGSLPLVAIPANLLAAPLVVPITLWGLVAGVVGGLLGSGVATVLQMPTALGLRFVAGVAAVAARHPGSVDGRALLGFAAVGAGFGSLAMVRRWSHGAGGVSGSGGRVAAMSHRPVPDAPTEPSASARGTGSAR